jgi:hypothetical protein
MTRETRIEIVKHAVRWTTNILVEVLNNHSLIIPPQARLSIKAAVSSLGDASQNLNE